MQDLSTGWQRLPDEVTGPRARQALTEHVFTHLGRTV